MFKVATMLLASTSATKINADAKDIDDKETKLSQSFAAAFNMRPPHLMNDESLPENSKVICPKPGKMLTNAASGGAFLDGCYMNTTRELGRNEKTGEEAQSYLYMWKHGCAYTKWVPSNQFMYSNLDYDADTMTLERFGFIGMDKRCYWGSIGVLWKRPLPVEQILPNTTVEVELPAPKPPKQKGPELLEEGQLFNVKSQRGDCLGTKGKIIQIEKCAKDKSDYWQYFDNGEIKHKKSGLCMSPVKSKINPGVQIQLQKCNGQVMQEWDQVSTKNGQFMIQVHSSKKLCVDLPGGRGNRGLKTQIWTCIPGKGDNFEYKWQK